MTEAPPSADRFAVEVFGVRVGFRSVHLDLLAEIRRELTNVMPPDSMREISYRTSTLRLAIGRNRNNRYVFFRGRKKISEANHREHFLRYFLSLSRIWIAENAPDLVFMHAGVVAWKGSAIVIPARSFAGKTTLVAELLKHGAEYYSDEYAVFDADGRVHPFAKPLSLREPDGDGTQRDVSANALGGKTGRGPADVGLVLITSFEDGAAWRPERISAGMGVLEMLPHAIPAAHNPEFTLNVLNKITNRAIIVKIKRGEAEDFAPKLLTFFENIVLKNVIIA